ncbi:MAG: amidohydrolase family protein, partial [Lachnospiraceae bacterium]|nr:amidohydrolase family protein [Lachnospiraceae bacterium]
MLVLKNGTIIDPASKFMGKRDIAIDGKTIVEIAENIPVTGNDEVYDCTDKYIGPGLVDVHVHFRDPGFTYKEDILSGAKAAAKGGVTSVILMANTKPAVDNEETIRYILEKGKQAGIHVYTCANV